MLRTRVFGGAASALRIPVYRHYFMGHFIASIGRWMYRMSIGWLAWDLTSSTVWLGAVAFADLVPSAVLTIFSGAITDRFGYMRIIRGSLVVVMSLATLLGVLVLTHAITVELLLVIALLSGSAESLGQPARLAIVNALVDVENAIVALRETTEQEALQAVALRSAERAYAISETQLRAGTIDLITVLNTQQSVFTARNQLAVIRLARLQAAVAMFRALGGGWA